MISRVMSEQPSVKGAAACFFDGCLPGISDVPECMHGMEDAMKWTRFTLNTTTKAVDLISSMLDEIGIEGIEIEDHVPLSEADTKGMFIDILPELPPDDGTARVSFYLEDLSDLERILRDIEEGLDDISRFVDVGEHGNFIDRVVNFVHIFIHVIFRNWLFGLIRRDNYDWKYERELVKKALKDAKTLKTGNGNY